MKAFHFLTVSFCSLSIVFGCATKSHSSASQDKQTAMSKEAAVEYDIAYEFYRTGDMIRAMGAALKSVELAPQNADARNLLGLIHFRRNEHQKAETQFKKAIEIDPHLTEALTNLGSLYYALKRYSEAEESLLLALDNPLYLYPERIYNNLGLVLSAQGNQEKAIEAFDQAITLRPEYYLPFQNLGKVLMEEGKYRRAQLMLSEAARLCESCSEPRYHLGTLLLKQNDRSKALAIFKEGFEIDPRGYYGQLCRQFLTEEK